jgi:hypothetical protein
VQPWPPMSPDAARSFVFHDTYSYSALATKQPPAQSKPVLRWAIGDKLLTRVQAKTRNLRDAEEDWMTFW